MKTTPLHPAHVSLDAQMIEFAGWDMPARYGSAIQEHHAVRSHAGMFDVSHMGRLFLDGPDALPLADSVVTADVTAIPSGHAKYCMACNESGGILDDLIVYRLPDQRIFIVCNASNREVIVNTIRDKVTEFPNATLVDRTEETAMIAVQGPIAPSIVQSLLPFNPETAPLFSITADCCLRHLHSPHRLHRRGRRRDHRQRRSRHPYLGPPRRCGSYSLRPRSPGQPPPGSQPQALRQRHEYFRQPLRGGPGPFR